MLVSTADGGFLWVNLATEELFGFSAAEFLGLNGHPLSWQDLTIDKEDLAADKAMGRALEVGERLEYSLEKSYRRKDGQPIPGRIHVLRWPPYGQDAECYLVTIVPLHADHDLLREDIAAMRTAFAEFVSEHQAARIQVTSMICSLGQWANGNKAVSAAIVLWISSLVAGDRVIEIAERLKKLIWP